MNHGNTTNWTAQAQLLLAEAERRYLTRDSTYRFLGVTIDESGPHIRFTPDWAGVSIELSPSAAKNADQALYQIAHEVIHLLAPVRSPPAMMLEEGIAVHFSIFVPEFCDPNYRTASLKHLVTNPNAKNYWDAFDLFNRLLAKEPNAIAILRSQRPHFFDMDSAFVMNTIAPAEKDLADKLCERRQMR